MLGNWAWVEPLVTLLAAIAGAWAGGFLGARRERQRHELEATQRRNERSEHAGIAIVNHASKLRFAYRNAEWTMFDGQLSQIQGLALQVVDADARQLLNNAVSLVHIARSDFEDPDKRIPASRSFIGVVSAIESVAGTVQRGESVTDRADVRWLALVSPTQFISKIDEDYDEWMQNLARAWDEMRDDLARNEDG